MRRAENRAFILATDTSVKYLLAYNIKFDAIVTVDGRKSIRHLQNEECLYYPIFTVPDAKSEILDNNYARKIWLTGSGYLEVLYKKFGCYFPEYNCGGSVATAAFWIAGSLKSKTIILVGQDLAYSGDLTHAGGVKIHNNEWSEETPLYIEGIDGKMVRTRSDWIGYLRWFENAIKHLNGVVEVIDATEGGAKIAGTKIMSLSDAIDKYCNNQFHFSHILERTPVTFNKEKYKAVCKDICNLKNEFHIIEKVCNEGIILSDRIMLLLSDKEIKWSEFEESQKRIKDIQKTIQEQDIYSLLDEYISADIADRLEVAAKGYDNDIEQFRENAVSVKVLFESLKNAVADLMPVLKQTIEEI